MGSFRKVGLETKWVIECKDWTSAIPKEKVLAFKSVVEDGNAVMRATGALAVPGFGFDRVRLKKPPYQVKFDESGERRVVVDTLDDFVAAPRGADGPRYAALRAS